MENTNNIVNVSGSCYDHVDVSMDGFWNGEPGESFLQNSLFRFHVQVVMTFFLINCFHFVLKRFHFSRFTSEILAGIVLGPTVMGKIFPSASNMLFPQIVPNHVVAMTSKIGYMFFIFFAGLRTDTKLIRKTGKQAGIMIAVMLVITRAMQWTLEFEYHHGDDDTSSYIYKLYFYSVVQTQFVGVSCLLMQVKIINSQLGHLALASSLVYELCRLAMGALWGFKTMKDSTSMAVAAQSVLISFALVVFICVVGRKMMLIFIRRTPVGTPAKEMYTSFIMAMALVLATGCDIMGLNYPLGLILFGLVVPARSPLAETLVAKFEGLVLGFLLPLMSSYCASRFNLWEFVDDFDIVSLPFKISLIGFLIKVVVTFLGGLLGCWMPVRHALALAVILNAKGPVEVGIFFSFNELQNVEHTSGIFLLFLLQAFQPHIVRKLYNPAEHYIGYKKKNVEHASKDAELGILVCAHRQEDAIAAVNILEYSNPTKQSPLSIFGLCLEELVSGFAPVLINHQLGQKNYSSEGNRSHPIIDIFKYFESQHNKSAASLNVFTAVSPVKQMHEDICWLSFDKSCSLIILPFHKKWNGKGKVVSGNTEWRNLNINVLERAPCSVGILINRNSTDGLSSIFVESTMYRVAVVFMGGADDRDALAYALRMARSPRVHLTVVHFIAHTDRIQCWDNMLDSEILRNARPEISQSTNMNFVEETVRDGNDTSAIIKSMVEDFDLIIVGRHHDPEPEPLSGLSEWTDLPELGPLGDLLASEDIKSPISVLVIQQQILKASHSSTLN